MAEAVNGGGHREGDHHGDEHHGGEHHGGEHHEEAHGPFDPDLMGELERFALVPLVELERAEDALPIADAFLAAGLPVMEIALRTKDALQAIEKEHGRVHDGRRWAARPLDLDLLVFGAQEICNDELTVPHPGIAKRGFVLLPLCELAPQLRIPGLSTAEQLLQELAANSAIDAVLDD